MQYTTHIGLDVHVETISAASASLDGVRMELGCFENTPGKVARRIRSWRKRFDRIHVVYEAGPCGYEIYRQLQGLGQSCQVVAPSLIPRRPGDRIKTDRRDAAKLARLSLSGDLTSVWVPDVRHEAIRELVRCREDIKITRRHRQQQINAMLHRHGRRWGREKWTLIHRRWLAEQEFEEAASQQVFVHYLESLAELESRIGMIEGGMAAAVTSWSLGPLVAGLMAMRGIKLITAMTLAAELGDVTRFTSAEELMAFVGVVPSEHSSGSTRRQGAISKTGNGHARRVLIESAWAYRHRPNWSKALLARASRASEAVRGIAWKAQCRLHRKYMRLIHRGKSSPQTIVAVAREELGFIWAIARQVMSEQTSIQGAVPN